METYLEKYLTMSACLWKGKRSAGVATERGERSTASCGPADR